MHVEFNSIIDLFCDMLDYIYKLFMVVDTNGFEKLLFMNSASDLVGLFLLLLPYIDDLNNLKTISKLNEIYTRKRAPCDIKIESPKYIFSNVQYSRCLRKPIKEIPFDMEHIKQNYLI